MHVFIDTNILLNFYHFSKDELDALNDIFASHEHGSATVYLTEQVQDEFLRNREVKIKDALKRFKEVKFTAQFPSFMKDYSEYAEIKSLCADLQAKRKTILKKVDEDITENNLIADKLIQEIFNKSDVIPTTIPLYEQAVMRMALGNPPGKNKSIGDAVNWIMLLGSVPQDHDIHIISEDSDFYSILDEELVHSFLKKEWKEKKNSEIYVYRTLSSFMGEHFDGVAFSFDKKKEDLIEELKYAGSFSVTHSIIAKLESYLYFSLKEVMKILNAADQNNQFGGIVCDYDVSNFLNRVAVPRSSSLHSNTHKEIIQTVIDEQKDRES